MTDWNQQRNSFTFLTAADVAAVALQAGQQAVEVGAAAGMRPFNAYCFFLPSGTG